MANTITRLTANGNYYIAGQFDEVTFNTNSGYSKNLLKNSNFYSGWNLGGGATFIANNAIAPDGTQTAGKLSFLTVGSEYIYQNMTWTANKYYTISIYVKPIAETFIQIESFQQYGYATFQLTGNGSLYSTYQSSVLITNTSISFDPKTGYYRCSATFFASANGSNNIGFTNGGSALTADAYYIWGAQAEIGTSLTIYQPTDANGNIASQNSVSKIDSTGSIYIQGNFDEVTGTSITNGLTLYLDGKITSSNANTWIDLSPKNVNVSLSNVSFSSANGGCLFFTGGSKSNYYANTKLPESSFISPANGTISVWFLPTGASPNMGSSSYGGGQHIWGESDVFGGNSDDYIWIVRGIRNGVDAIYCGLWDNTQEHFVAVPYTVNQWINITWLHTSNTLYGYSNGQLVGSVTANNAIVSSLITYIAGCPPYNPGLSGYIGKVQAYNRALTPAEIQINYNADAARFNLTPIAVPSVQKISNTGITYISGNYDEYTKGQNLVTNGLIYYMDPSKPESWNGSGTVINDITKTNPSGTLVGGYTYNYQNGGVIQFDGLTGYANTNILGNTAQFQTNSTYTLSIWAKLTGNSATTSGSAGTWQTTIFGSLDYAGYGIYGYEYGGSNILQQVQAGIRCSGVNVSSTSQNLTLGVWYNFVMTYNGTGSGTQGLNFYVNGASVYSNATVATGQLNLGSTDVISMGKNLPQSNAPAGTWPGQIGQALIYNRALSSAEVSQNFQEMRSQYGV